MLSGYEAELAAGGSSLEQASGSSWVGQGRGIHLKGTVWDERPGHGCAQPKSRC